MMVNKPKHVVNINKKYIVFSLKPENYFVMFYLHNGLSLQNRRVYVTTVRTADS